mgnify:CR=1 FL=1
MLSNKVLYELKNMYLFAGRVNGAPADTIRVVEAETLADATTLFTDRLRTDAGDDMAEVVITTCDKALNAISVRLQVPVFENSYNCPKCSNEWVINADSGCDDRCGECRTSCTPLTSNVIK